MRELRSRQAKLDKKTLPGRASISYNELRALFPILRETAIRGKLVNECQCEIVRVRTSTRGRGCLHQCSNSGVD